ncbi:MAG: helix-turn-helix transcriptional regulator [Acidothermales bacterium]|jgi:DNA-binding transcriptional ArsR family regulator|nr:helix-turn-helix transcriptional regulator [Acidothermales bacterium]
MSRKHVEDLATLRAYAHPLRWRLLAALRVYGPATASELGRRFGETSGATSYHLRQLARFGFITEDEDQPSRRERRWRAAHEATTWSTADFLDDPEARAAVDVIKRDFLRYHTEAVQGWYAEQAQWPREWVDAAVSTDLYFRLRPADLAELNRELREVLERYRDRPADDPQAARVLLFLEAFPTREVRL